RRCGAGGPAGPPRPDRRGESAVSRAVRRHSRTRTGAAGGGYRGRRADALCGPAHQRAAARPGEAVHAEGTGAGQRAAGDGRLVLLAPQPGGVAGGGEGSWTGPAAGRPRPAARRVHSEVVIGGWSMELYALPAHALRQMLDRGEISSVELTKSLIERIEAVDGRSEEHTSELQSRENLVCRLLLEKKKKQQNEHERSR